MILSHCHRHLGDIRVKTKVFVMHGVSDAMVPYTEALALHKTLPDTEIFLSGLARHSTMNSGANRGLEGFRKSPVWRNF